MPGYLLTTRSRSEFKKILGNANHLIITLLVGLDAIEKGIIDQVPNDLRAAWSPIDAARSAQRSRRMLLDMALLRAVDALDIYIRYASRKPFLIQSDEVRKELDLCGHSVFGRFNAVNNYYSPSDPIFSALILLLIAWRNRAAHNLAETQLEDRYRQQIEKNTQQLQIHFSGLDGNSLLKNFEENGEPRFKEIASFVNVVQRYVRELEQAFFRKLDQEKYLREVVSKGISVMGDTEEDRNRRRQEVGRERLGKEWR